MRSDLQSRFWLGGKMIVVKDGSRFQATGLKTNPDHDYPNPLSPKTGRKRMALVDLSKKTISSRTRSDTKRRSSKRITKSAIVK